MSASTAELLRTARREAGLTQAELAARLGTSQAAVARLERADTNPRLATLERALRAAGQRLQLSAAAADSGVDETLIAQRLRLTPAERLRSFQASHRSLAPLRGAASRARAGRA
jgi:transcriptional regulator with XRE-family HTH domain